MLRLLFAGLLFGSACTALGANIVADEANINSNVVLIISIICCVVIIVAFAGLVLSTQFSMASKRRGSA